MRKWAGVAFVGLAGLVVAARAMSLRAQVQTADTRLAFEVASVKPSPPGSRGAAAPTNPDTYARRNSVFLWYAADAYDVSVRQVVGLPSAFTTARFDVTAKAPFVPTPEQRREMLQRLLAERFALRAHRETRNLEVYALRLGKNFGRSTKGFKQANADCAAIKSDPAKPDGNAPPMVNPFGGPVCSSFMYLGNAPLGADHYFASGVTMAELVGNFAGIVNRIVIDETKLTGYFDLDFTYDRSSARATSSLAAGSAASFFTAVSDVGLRLDGVTAPVDVVVIDHIEPPTEN